MRKFDLLDGIILGTALLCACVAGYFIAGALTPYSDDQRIRNACLDVGGNPHDVYSRDNRALLAIRCDL